jgi:hypothetical protein
VGRINVAGYGLALGALGQSLLLNRFVGKMPFWLYFVPLLGPWLLVHVISFCRVAPCGPRRFAQMLIIAMAWYTFDTLVCELVWLLDPAGRSLMYSAAIPLVLCYGSAAVFIVFVSAVREARKY